MNQSHEHTPVDWKNKYLLLHKEVIQLREELRFATVLIALLLILGLWGFWQQPGSSGEMGTRLRRPSTQGNAPFVPPVRGLVSPPITNPSVAPPTVRIRPAPAFSTDWRFKNVPKLRPEPPIRIGHPSRFAKTSTKVPNRTKYLNSANRWPRKRLRFGDSIPSHLAPAHWCQPGFVYGSYRLCLQRDQKRRCIRRSLQRKYTCIPLSWKRKPR